LYQICQNALKIRALVCLCVERGERVKEALHAFLTSVLDGTDCLALGFGRLNFLGVSLFTCWKGRWLIHSAVVDGEISLLCCKSKHVRAGNSPFQYR
jgi:hypothetical protein